MKNFLVFSVLTLSAALSSAATPSLVCSQGQNQNGVVVTFDAGTRVLEVNKNGVAKDYTITRESGGSGSLSTVLLGESAQYGGVQVNLNSKNVMVYQKSSSEVDYLTCVSL